jgi:hypothetical protein
MTKMQRICKKYELLPPKIAESGNVSLGHGLSGSGRSIYNNDIIRKTMFALKMIDPATGWFDIIESKNKSATSI